MRPPLVAHSRKMLFPYGLVWKLATTFQPLFSQILSHNKMVPFVHAILAARPWGLPGLATSVRASDDDDDYDYGDDDDDDGGGGGGGGGDDDVVDDDVVVVVDDDDDDDSGRWWLWVVVMVMMMMMMMMMVMVMVILIFSWNPKGNPNDCTINCSMGPGPLKSFETLKENPNDCMVI